MADDDQLIQKYRPQDFDNVIGNKANCDSIKANLNAASRPHAFLFHGTPGTGKSTLAEIIAYKVGCASKQSIILHDAAADSSVDGARDVVEKMMSFPLDGGKAKMLIIEEAQELSKKAWTPFLTILEKPPSHAYFAFTTSDRDKIDRAIFTRVQAYNIKPAPADELEILLMEVCLAEDIALPEGAIDVIIKEAKGSTRQALSFLSKVRDVNSLDLVHDLLEAAKKEDESTGNAWQLAQAMIKGNRKIGQLLQIADGMIAAPSSKWGGYKITMANEITKNMREGVSSFMPLLPVLDAVNDYPPFPKDEWQLKSELYLMIGRYLINTEPSE